MMMRRMHHRRRSISLAGVAATALIAACSSGSGTGGPTTSGGGPATTPVSASGTTGTAAAGRYVTTDGSRPTRFPDLRQAVGPATIDAPLASVRATLETEIGPVAEDLPATDAGETGHRRLIWRAGGGSVEVAVNEPAATVDYVTVSSPAGSGLRVALYGGTAVGTSTLGEVIRALGPPTDPNPQGDYAAMWIYCDDNEVIGLKVNDREPSGPATPTADPAQVIRWVDVFHSVGPTTECNGPAAPGR